MTNKELSRYFGQILAEEIRFMDIPTAYSLVPIDSMTEAESEPNENDKKAYSVVTHKQGSWKWQKRHALVAYKPHTLKNGKKVWKSHEVLSNKVTPGRADDLHKNGYAGNKVNYGSLHHQAIEKYHTA